MVAEPIEFAGTSNEPLSPLWWVARLQKKLDERRPAIQLLSRYYEGDHPLPSMPERAGDAFRRMLRESRANWCGLVVDAVAERLHVEGFRTSATDEAADADAWAFWQTNNFDAQSELVHSEAFIGGVAYVCVWPDPDSDEPYPLITPESACEVIHEYEPGRHRKVAAAYKSWRDDWTGDTHSTLYLPDAIYKYRRRGEGSSPWREREPTIVNRFEQVPVIPFENRPRLLSGGRSEIEDILDIQDRINKTIFDRLMASEFAAFRQRWATGMEIPTDEEGKPVEPFRAAVDRLWISEDPDTSFGEFSATDLAPYVAAVEADVRHLAAVSKTPPHYLLGEMVNVSGDALKAAESGLTAKARSRIRHFGECLAPDSKVVLADGRKMKIRDIVKNRLPVEVLSVDATGRLVPARVVNWHANPRRDRPLFNMSYKSIGKRYGWRRVTATADHHVLLKRGWVRLDEVRTGIDLVATGEPNVTGPYLDMVVGSLLGDASTSVRRPDTARLTITHTTPQANWLRWKVRALAPLGMCKINVNRKGPSRVRMPNDALRSSSRSLASLKPIHDAFYVGGRKVVPEALVDMMGPLALAVWYCDDGSLKYPKWNGKRAGRPWMSIATCGFEVPEVQYLADVLRERFGVAGVVDKDADGGSPRIRLRVDATAAFAQIIGPFVPPSMRYKLPDDAPPFDPTTWVFDPPEVFYDVVEVEQAPIRRRRPPSTVYDIEVEDHHNFVTNGGVVHNSWERVMRLCFAVVDDERSGMEGMETIWADPEYRTEGELVDALTKMQTLGVPLPALWEKWGASQSEIARWQELLFQQQLQDQAMSLEGGLMGAEMAGAAAPEPFPEEAV